LYAFVFPQGKMTSQLFSVKNS
ncbi:hypothetical protein CP061683_1159B, partial [Chlamydia psittaci 06-1683]